MQRCSRRCARPIASAWSATSTTPAPPTTSWRATGYFRSSTRWWSRRRSASASRIPPSSARGCGASASRRTTCSSWATRSPTTWRARPPLGPTRPGSTPRERACPTVRRRLVTCCARSATSAASWSGREPAPPADQRRRRRHVQRADGAARGGRRQGARRRGRHPRLRRAGRRDGGRGTGRRPAGRHGGGPPPDLSPRRRQRAPHRAAADRPRSRTQHAGGGRGRRGDRAARSPRDARRGGAGARARASGRRARRVGRPARRRPGADARRGGAAGAAARAARDVTSPDGQVTVAAAGWCFAAEAAVAADGVLPHLAIRFAAVGDAALDGLQGQYLALAMDRRDGRLVAAPDQLGLFPVYVAEDDGVAWVTTAALPLAVGLGARLDVEALRALFMESAIRSPRSAFAGIRRASFGERVTITAGRAHVARRWLPYRAARAYRRIEDAADEGGGLLRATARKVRAAWPAWVADLTSGLDSRLVVAALAEPGAPV